MALNEQAMESYIRMFLENQMITQEFYLRYVLLSHIDQTMSRLNISVELFEVKCSLSLFVPHTHIQGVLSQGHGGQCVPW